MAKPNPDFDAFTRTVDKLLSVSHDELKRRLETYKEEAAKNPTRSGPKPKTKDIQRRDEVHVPQSSTVAT